MDQGGRVGLQPGGERHGEDQEDQRGQRWPWTPQAHKGREVTKRCRLHCKKCRRTFRRTFKEFCPDFEKIQYNITDEIFWLSSHVFFFYPANEQESSTLALSKNFVLISD